MRFLKLGHRRVIPTGPEIDGASQRLAADFRQFLPHLLRKPEQHRVSQCVRFEEFLIDQPRRALAGVDQLCHQIFQ